jgi:hypothetical protein
MKKIQLITYAKKSVIPPDLLNQFRWDSIQWLFCMRKYKVRTLDIETRIISGYYVPYDHEDVVYSIVSLIEYTKKQIIEKAGNPEVMKLWDYMKWAKYFNVNIVEKKINHDPHFQ